jgi:hypothetical protein
LIPERQDPRWREVVSGKRRYELENLAARMLLTRLRLRTMHGDEQALNEAVGAAFDFFERNEATTQADVKALFGSTP